MGNQASLAPTISVLNMKGGVGKTTISAHLFRHLAEKLGKSVLLIDFDPQFNLTQTLMSRSTFEKTKLANKTIFSVMEPDPEPSLFKITSGMGPPPSVESVVVPLRVWTQTKNPAISLLAGDFRMTKYTLVDDQKALQPVRNRFLDFINNARQQYDLVCIDCNPSSSFMTVCALLASTHLLVPVRPDRYSILGLELLNEFIDHVPVLTSKPKQIVLVNGTAAKHDVNVENTLRADPKLGPITLPTTLKFSGLLSAKEGQTGFATERRVAHMNALKQRFSRIVDDLKTPLGW
ncbi:ParA family protein [Burkholderia cenocepacia]|uniref:ParA family protein n=1 Tax=Burkholderia cenocepacia TaxID=95486 RepID=UPI001BA367E8|nr:ParA family protein [Burkholderia cenocepacia]MBR8095072.1 ParA family protein [Burkholderia cenocepacia]MDI9684818.1 ParA family protein [Burkholderia cenocepacia]HEP6429729.1 ParA family protein [Burkholderia cenocepacia]